MQIRSTFNWIGLNRARYRNPNPTLLFAGNTPKNLSFAVLYIVRFNSALVSLSNHLKKSHSTLQHGETEDSFLNIIHNWACMAGKIKCEMEYDAPVLVSLCKKNVKPWSNQNPPLRQVVRRSDLGTSPAIYISIQISYCNNHSFRRNYCNIHSCRRSYCSIISEWKLAAIFFPVAADYNCTVMYSTVIFIFIWKVYATRVLIRICRLLQY
jgi:hypothetical protein